MRAENGRVEVESSGTPVRGLVVGVFAAMLLNYVDKQMLALLKPMLDAEFGWSDADYGQVVAASQFAAAICLPLMGWIADVVSTRRCFAFGVAAWSVLTMAQALATGTKSMLVVRVALNGAEAIGMPAALKAVSTIIPGPERAHSLALLNLAPSTGALVGPLLVPPLAFAFGWRLTAVIVGFMGLIWVGWWLRASAAAREFASPPPPAGTLKQLISIPAIWFLIAAKGLTDQLWWIFLFWLPDFLFDQSSGETVRWAGSVAVIYLFAGIGSIVGGSVASRAITSSGKMGAAFGCGAVTMILLILIDDEASSLNLAACAGAILLHQILSVLTYTALSEPRFRPGVGTVVGLAAFVGNGLAILSLALVGRVLTEGFGYGAVFTALGGAYMVGAACLAIGLYLLNNRSSRSLRS